MKIFLDTNIILEFLCRRQQSETVDQMIVEMLQRQYNIYISGAGLYTITYIYEMFLKKQGIANPKKLQTIREKINDICDILDILSTDKQSFKDALINKQFKDLEDSYQYHTAKSNDCDFIITLNTKHFKTDPNSKPKVYCPQEFLEYLHNYNF